MPKRPQTFKVGQRVRTFAPRTAAGLSKKELRATINNRRWRRLRKQVQREAFGICEVEGCDNEGTIGEHTEDRAVRPDLAFDRGNVRCMCAYHANRKTRLTQLGRFKGYRYKEPGAVLGGAGGGDPDGGEGGQKATP